MLHYTGIIPSRFASTRFPGKPLAIINGKTMIERVYNQSRKVLDDVYVATDDTRIETEVIRFGGKVIMTSSLHQSGTDRCAEAAGTIEKTTGKKIDVVINIQGDEPFIQPEQLTKLMGCFSKTGTQIATLIKQVHSDEEIADPNRVKVTFDNNFNALYFSRSPIPYLRNKENSKWTEHHNYYHHLGIYAYRTDILKILTTLPQSSLELAESLEQLRWIENGYKIHLEITEFENFPVDTPLDLEKIKLMNFPE